MITVSRQQSLDTQWQVAMIKDPPETGWVAFADLS